MGEGVGAQSTSLETKAVPISPVPTQPAVSTADAKQYRGLERLNATGGLRALRIEAKTVSCNKRDMVCSLKPKTREEPSHGRAFFFTPPTSLQGNHGIIREALMIIGRPISLKDPSKRLAGSPRWCRIGGTSHEAACSVDNSVAIKC